RSPAEIGAQAEIVFSCLPSSQALEEVVHGAAGLLKSARPGQIIVELGSHPVPDKERHLAPLAAKGAAFLDGEVSGTPGMVAARKAVIYLAGDKEACARAERVVGGNADARPRNRALRKIHGDGLGREGRRRHGRRHRRAAARKNVSAIEQAGTEARMIRVKKIAHASYDVPDVDKQVEYYTDILGLT